MAKDPEDKSWSLDKLSGQEIVSGLMGAVAGGWAVAYSAGEKILKPFTKEKMAEELAEIGAKNAELGKSATLQYMKTNPPPMNPEGLALWKENVTKLAAESPAAKELVVHAEELAEKALAAETYRTAWAIEKPLLAFEAAPMSIKVAVLGAAAAAAIGAGYLVRSMSGGPKSHTERLERERAQAAASSQTIE